MAQHMSNVRKQVTAHDVFNWWMMYDILPGQMDMFEEDTDD